MTTPDPICGRHRVQRLCSRTAPRRTQRHFRSAQRRCQGNEAGLTRSAAFVGLLGAVGRDVLDGLGEQDVQGLPLGVGQGGEYLVVDVAKCPVEVREQALTAVSRGR